MKERHPISPDRSASLDRRVQMLEEHLSRLWDQVWWMQLPEDVRKGYEVEGFTAPIQSFYEKVE